MNDRQQIDKKRCYPIFKVYIYVLTKVSDLLTFTAKWRIN